MEVHRCRPFLLLVRFLFLYITVTSAADPVGNYCSQPFQGITTRGSINKVLTDLSARAPLDGFAVSSSSSSFVGSIGSEAAAGTIYGLAQCRGDVSTSDCSSCIVDAVKQLPQSCPGQTDARIWYDFCFLRYSNRSFFGEPDTGYALILINTENATDPEAFDAEVGKLMTQVRQQAAAVGSKGLGRGTMTFSPYVTIYGLGQCTRDLTQLPCAQCLAEAVTRLPDYCRFRRGCRILYSSCLVRYEIYPFFFPVVDGRAAHPSAVAAAGASKDKYLKVVLKS